MNPSCLRFLVPREWSGHQALLVVELLGEVRNAIWDVHGESMAGLLDEDQRRFEHLKELFWDDEAEMESDPPPDLDDMPF